MTVTPETKIKNLTESLHYSGIVLLGLDDLASKLARLAKRSSRKPEFDVAFNEIRASVLTDIKNLDVSGASIEAEAKATTRALETLSEMMDIIRSRADEPPRA